MSDIQASFSDESMDWTLVDQEGTVLKSDIAKSSSESSLSGIDLVSDHVPEISQELVTEVQAKIAPVPGLSPLHLERTLVVEENEPVSDSDFVHINEDEDHADDWLSATAAVVEQRRRESLLENSRTSFENDDGEDLTSDCTEVDSNEDDSSAVSGSDSESEVDDAEDRDDSDVNSAPLVNDETVSLRNQDFRPSLLPLNLFAQNTNVNDVFSVVMIVVLAVVTGVAVGHFVGSGCSGLDHETSRPMDGDERFDRASTLALSDVQKGQVEILKQLQEMIHLQGDLKQRITTLEDENRDLRLRLMESRKRCTRILHKNPLTLLSSSTARTNHNFTDNGLDRIHLNLTFPLARAPLSLVERLRNPHRSIFEKRGALQLTIAAVVVPPKLKQDPLASTQLFNKSPLLQTVMPATGTEEAPFVISTIQHYEPFYYPMVDLEEISKAALFPSVQAGVLEDLDYFSDSKPISGAVLESLDYFADFDATKDLSREPVAKPAAGAVVESLDYFAAFEELINQRNNAAFPPAAPVATATTTKINTVGKVVKKSAVPTFVNESSQSTAEEKSSGYRKKDVHSVAGIKKVIKKEKDRIQENRRKFEEDYAEFKARWKNMSASEGAEKQKPKDKRRDKCTKGKESRDCDDGYCYTKPKHTKFEKKEHRGEKNFWDSLPPIIKKHLSKSSKVNKILRGLGTDIVQSKVFQKVVEEVPKRLKMSSEWWGCQFNWWKNYARNRRVSAYEDCAGYLTSWQNRQRQESMHRSRKECRAPVEGKKKTRQFKKEVVEEDPWENENESTQDWFLRRGAVREEQRSPSDWSLSRATTRQKLRVFDRYPDIQRPANTSWWFFQRARERQERRFSASRNGRNGISDAIPGDPIYSFLKHRAMWHGSPMHHP